MELYFYFIELDAQIGNVFNPAEIAAKFDSSGGCSFCRNLMQINDLMMTRHAQARSSHLSGEEATEVEGRGLLFIR